MYVFLFYFYLFFKLHLLVKVAFYLCNQFFQVACSNTVIEVHWQTLNPGYAYGMKACGLKQILLNRKQMPQKFILIFKKWQYSQLCYYLEWSFFINCLFQYISFWHVNINTSLTNVYKRENSCSFCSFSLFDIDDAVPFCPLMLR